MIGCTSRRGLRTHSVASQALSFALACCLPSPHFIFIHSHPPPTFFLIQLFIHQCICSPSAHSGFIPSIFSSSSLHPCPHISSSASLGPCLSKECFHNRMLLNNTGHYANLSFIQRIKKKRKRKSLLCQGQNKSPSGDAHER